MAAKACYNIEEAPLVFGRMDKATSILMEKGEEEGSEEKETGSKSSRFDFEELLSTHPSFVIQ